MSLPEVWLRGPIPGVPHLLQPVAQALLQSGEEVQKLMQDFPDEKLWVKPAGVASVGFHLQHLKGVLDRLFSYAKGQSLTQEQLQQLKAEGEPVQISQGKLVQAFHDQIAKSIEQLKQTSETTLLNPVGVGRKQLPSTVLGLLFHGAEHTQRHTGQLLVTVRVLVDKQ